MTRAPVDFEHLKTYTAGDLSVEREVLGLFVHQVELWIRMLQESGDDEIWRDAAHSLKGSARGIGAWHVAELCEQAESLPVDADPSERSAVLDDIKAAIAAVVESIDAHLGQESVA